MDSLSVAVSATLQYSSFFNYPLTTHKLHHWLITSTNIAYATIRQRFPQKLKSSQIRSLQLWRRESLQKIRNHQSLLGFLNRIPTIVGVFATGSVAVDNAREGDDLDLMIITKSNTLWLTRLFLVPLLRSYYHLRRPLETRPLAALICINLWLDESELSVPNSLRSLYTAHEVLQVRPLINKNSIHQRFLSANSWTSNYLANAFFSLSDHRQYLIGHRLSIIFLPLNYVSYLLQRLYMIHRKTREFLSLHSAYFHPQSPPKIY